MQIKEKPKSNEWGRHALIAQRGGNASMMGRCARFGIKGSGTDATRG